MNEWMMFLLTCDKKLTKSQLSPTHASTKRKIMDELKHVCFNVCCNPAFLAAKSNKGYIYLFIYLFIYL